MQKRLGSLLLSALLVAALILAATTKVAHAYIDIASGSLMIQMLVAVAFSSLLAIKIFWHRLATKASRIFSRMRGSEPEAK